MTDPRGILYVSAGGVEYRLHFGFSALAEVQGKHGKDFDSLVNGEFEGLPPLQVIHDLFTAALRRYHPEAACDRYIVDDIIAQNPGAFADFLNSSISDSGPASVEGKGPQKASG